jgi:hypothetical protein
MFERGSIRSRQRSALSFQLKTLGGLRVLAVKNSNLTAEVLAKATKKSQS